MTALCKPVSREVARDPRPIIVSLVPAEHGVPAMLEFREKGRRRRFSLPVLAAYQEAVRRSLAVPGPGRKPRRGLLRM